SRRTSTVRGASRSASSAWWLLARESVDHVVRGTDPAEDAALGLDHPEADLVELGKVGRARVGDHETAIAAIVGLAHGGVDADLGGDPAHEQALDGAALQDHLEVGRVERALARLVDDGLVPGGVQRFDDV